MPMMFYVLLHKKQIVPGQDICHVCHFIKDVNVIRIDSFYKFQSTVFCHRNEVGLYFSSKVINVLLILLSKTFMAITLIL